MDAKCVKRLKAGISLSLQAENFHEGQYELTES
jgi:hypothetical protein